MHPRVEVPTILCMKQADPIAGDSVWTGNGAAIPTWNCRPNPEPLSVQTGLVARYWKPMGWELQAQSGVLNLEGT